MTGWSGVCLRMVGLLTLAALQACTPALNWRQVQLQDLKARLPCKADTATRPVPLAATPLDLQMMGCEADGALFAISHVRAQDTEAATRVVQQWRAFALQALRTEASQPASWQAPAWATQAVSLRAGGQNPKGQPVQARLTWIRRGADVYHLAVYAETLTESITQPFLEDLQTP